MKRLMTGFAILMMAAGCGKSENNANSDNNDPNNGTGKGDFSAPLVCDIDNRSGIEVDGSLLQDPFAGFAMRGGDCPSSFTEIVEKLAAAGEPTEGEEDEVLCTGGMESYVISETAQPEGTPNGNGYRVVVSRDCGDQDNHEMMFSLFGVRPAKDDPGANAEDWLIPDDGVEIAAFDRTNNVYNFYLQEGGEVQYFGHSGQFIRHQGGRCNECHRGGALTMKELDTPWLHWEGHMDVPGARDLVAAHENVLGRKASGSTLERFVKDAAREYNPHRIEDLALNATTQDLLAPLFCDTEFNIDNFTDFDNRDVTRIPRDFWVDPFLGGSSVSMDNEAYEAAIADAGQRLAGVDTDRTDTVFKGPFLERAFSDNNYVEQLIDRGIVDDDLVRDIMMINFTNPILNNERCGLLAWVPEVDVTAALIEDSANNANSVNGGLSTGMTGGTAEQGNNNTGEKSIADQIREGMIEQLSVSSSRGSLEDELLSNLENTDDSDAHQERVSAFFTACNARDKNELATDIMRVLSWHRNTASSLELFEFPTTLPADDLNETTPLIWTESCELQ